MILEQRKTESRPVLDPEEIAQSGLVPQFGMVTRALWASPVRNALLLLAAGLVVVVVVTAYGQIRLNRWNQPFYDALSRHDYPAFVSELGVFAVIAGSLLALNVAQRWLDEMVKLRLREGLVHDLVENWLRPGRAFRLENAGAIGVNPDQRMHEDARHLTELTAGLGVGLLQSSILLATFINVLWNLSNGFAFHLMGRAVAIPGYMVWAAVLYSGSASLLSYWVGKGLIDRNADRYAREADLRFSMVRVNEHIDEIALASGESDEARRIGVDIDRVLESMRRLVTGLTNLEWVTSGYGWFTIVAPILVAAPIYFAGELTFGGLMMASGAFVQVQSSLRWFVDNFSTLADWRATLLRVASFRRAVLNTDVLHDLDKRIAYDEDGPPGKLVIDSLTVASPAGDLQLSERRFEMTNTQRTLILGESAAADTRLFRALAGLWPWGAGRISRAKGEETLYLPRAPYMPPGTLREVLAYPRDVSAFPPDAFRPALERLQLSRLIPMLDAATRWDRELTEDEQHRLPFARALLHGPRWMIIDELIDALEERTQPVVLAALKDGLGTTGIIYLARSAPRNLDFDRTVKLAKA